MCRTKKAGVQWFSTQLYPMCNHVAPLHPSHYRFSPLPALQRDRQWTPMLHTKRVASSQIRDQWMWNGVCKYFQFIFPPVILSRGTLIKYFVCLVLIVLIFHDIFPGCSREQYLHSIVHSVCDSAVIFVCPWYTYKRTVHVTYIHILYVQYFTFALM
jgi:hypothetical protein